MSGFPKYSKTTERLRRLIKIRFADFSCKNITCLLNSTFLGTYKIYLWARAENSQFKFI